MAISAAIDEYVKKTGRNDIRIWGYRNVWSYFKLGEVNTVIPISLNSLAVLHNMFNTCFISQRTASFPSHEFDGTFSELAQKYGFSSSTSCAVFLATSFSTKALAVCLIVLMEQFI